MLVTDTCYDAFRMKQFQKILLINPPGKITVTKEGSRERKLAVPHLGLAYLAANLRKHGYDVEILDVLIDGFHSEVAKDNAILYGLDNDEIRRRIQKSQPDLVGISCIISNRSREVLSICALVKEVMPTTPVVLGGQHPSGMPEMIHDKNVDYILRGESDNSLVEFLSRLNKGEDISSVPGIVYKDKGRMQINPKQDYPDVNVLPLPAWDLFQLDKYWLAGVFDYEISQQKDKCFIILITSRGCPHNCYFCTSTLMSGRKYRPRRIKDVVGEIRRYKEGYDVAKILFWDDNFFVHKTRVKKLLGELIAHFPGMEFEVPSGSEINAIDDEMISLMARAGFKKIFLAVESPNPSIQKDQIDKKVKLDRIPIVVQKARAAGLITEGSFMVGFPGESKEQIDHTFEMATQFGFDRISISIVNPLPGTGLYKKCVDEQVLFPDYDPQDIRWSTENIKLDVPRGYISARRRETWVKYMKDRISIDQYENEKVKTPQK